MFAFVSATLHQIWFYWNGRTENWLNSSLAMGVGDWLGTALVLAFASLVIKCYKLMASNSIDH